MSEVQSEAREEMRCVIVWCKQKARYELNYTLNGKKYWVKVCPEHEILIGDENEQRTST